MIKKIIIFALFLFSCRQQRNTLINNPFEIDTKNKTITFEAYLNPTKDEKYFLFYFEGYPWIKNYCLFVSSYQLKHLQDSLSLIDWEMWDDIYVKKIPPKVEIKLLVDNSWYDITEFIKFENFNTYQTAFWGSYIYDEVVIRNTHKKHMCVGCPLLPLEQSNIIGGLMPLNYKFIKDLKNNTVKVKLKFK